MEHYSWEDCQEGTDGFDNGTKEKSKEFKEKALRFLNEHGPKIIGGTVMILSIVAGINHDMIKYERLKQDKKRERMIYDPVLGDYWELKKPLSNKEKLEFEQRLSEGEMRGEILKDMRKLKR